MVSIYHFEKSLKLSWFKKIINETTSNPPPWFTLLTTDIGNLENLTRMVGFEITKNYQPVLEYCFLILDPFLAKKYP